METRKRRIEPFLWALFSAGGVVAALFLPVHLALFGLAIPLGLVDGPTHERALEIVRNPLVRVYLFVLCSLPLFHWAHRFKFTLYDGLQIKHLNPLVNGFCYGGAVLGTLLAAYLLISVP